MSLFNKYKPYLYDMLDEAQRKKIGVEMFTHLTTLTSNPENGGTPNVYLGSFTKSDMGFVAELFSDFVEDSHYDKGEKFNTEILNDIVAGYALNNLWLAVQKDYGTEDKLREALKNKSEKIPESLAYLKEKNEGILNNYLQMCQSVGIRMEGLSIGADLSSAFDKLLDFYTLLNTPMMSEEERIKMETLKAFADDLWDEVIPIYSELYKSSIERGCKGVLTTNGYLTLKDGEIKKSEDIWVSKLYSSFIASSIFPFKITEKFQKLTRADVLENNYLAKYHTLNVFGVIDINTNQTASNWKEFVPHLRKRFYQLAYVLLSSYELNEIAEHYNDLKAVLTNCVVIESYDRSLSIQLAYKLDNVSLEYNDYFATNCKAITGRENCKILKNSCSQNNVISLFGVFDAKKFALEPLFSYQAYDNFVKRGGKVGLDKIIIGRKLDGSDLEFSLKSNDTRITSILAGSGSGKGVMTLGLLSAIVSNKIPFIYLDYKPDMAEMLWNVEEEFKKAGITRTDGKEARILAIDAKLDMDTCNPVRKHRFAENLPDYLSDIPNTVFAVLPYLKLLQLYYILGSLRANEANKPEYGGAMTFAILDEFQANIKDNLSKLITTLNSEVKIAKQNGDERYNEMSAYVMRLKNLVARLANETGTFINTDGRKSQCRAIYLGQNADYSVWKSDKVQEVANLSSEWYSKTSFRFFGRNGGSGSYAPANSGSIAEFVNNKDTFGYWTFAVGAGKVSEVKDWDVFKAYSVLNVNDYNIDSPSESGRCTSGVLNNIPDESIKNYVANEIFVSYDENGVRIPRPEIGFLGLVKKLSGLSDNEIADALSEGYEVIWKVMCLYGLNRLYPDVETYLFDASLESIYTTDEIRAGVTNNTGSSAKGDMGESVFGEGFFDNPTMSDEEKREAYLKQKEEQKRQEELKKINQEKESALKEINALKSKYGEKISKAGKSLYSYKKDEVLFNDAKQSILDTREGYMTGFMEVIEKVNDSVLQGELISVATLFLDERFKSIEDMTFEGIQGGRAGDDREGGGGTSTGNPIGYTGTSNNPPAPVRQDNPRQVNTFQGQKVGGKIDTKGEKFNLDEYEDGGGFGKGSKNLKLLEDITTLVIRDVRRQFGGAQGISEISINAGGGLVIDGFVYSPEFEPELVESMPATKQQYYKAGNLAKIINIGAVVDSIIPYAMSLSIETPAVAEDVTFQRELGIKKKNNYAALFKSCHNLQIIRLPNEELTRDNPNSLMEGNSGGGLGAKLAGLFGFGKGRKDSANYVPNTASSDNSDSLSNRIFDSKPVRVMTSALGWTLGVKAVVMAATIFGPWGLLFGAFAAAGAYKEIKKDNQNKTDARRESRGSSSSSSTKSSKDKSSGGFSGTYDKKK